MKKNSLGKAGTAGTQGQSPRLGSMGAVASTGERGPGLGERAKKESSWERHFFLYSI